MVTASSDKHVAERATNLPTAGRAGALIAVLAALTAVAPLAIDMYVPGFPSMGQSLGTTSSAVQLTMTAFLAGLVVGQVLLGPVSDAIGRRGLLIGGSAGFAVVSVLCALAPNVELLTAARFLHGVAGAVGMVLARAVLTDLFHGPALPRYFALLAQITGIAPIVAPVIGGAILAVSTWRAVFAALAVVGVLLLVSVLAKVPESLPRERRRSDGLGGTFRAMGRLAADRSFLGYVLVLAFASAAMFTYIAGSSFVFESIHGVSATAYSVIFACNALGMLVASSVFGRLAGRVGLTRLLTVGVGILTVGAAGQVVVRLVAGETMAGTLATLFLTLVGVGVIFPATMTIGQTLGRGAPGAASALLGGLQFLAGALVSPLVGLFGDASSLPMATIMLGAALLTVAALVVMARPGRGLGEPVPVRG
ncbi:multidrug effflux MFS transporter [Actinocorallia sp. A-T 12471]|uniref:multidrug effflux MFS transporter n=1 Tax=Actinocorallia sp. A-T 12471 TaxID=3089813 RepID=UPI0029D20762|nr:multidrug effflux MFS transporter [Actinocorallia sp. A-T 12471]MDX6744172.1 multidrug effflux MFS transporter [Actinocorallia sp. A-T 12471]